MLDTTAPINSLPPEILSDIFHFVHAYEIDLTYKGSQYPWILSLVCRLWNDIMFTTPSLWVTIHLDSDRVADITPHLDAVLALCNVCLERSKQHPLAFSIHKDYTGRGTVLVPLFMELAIRHTGRWENIVLNVPITTLTPILHPNIQYPCLRSLSLGDAKVLLEVPSISPPLLFDKAPLISALTLNAFSSPLVQLHLPWSQITDFTMIIPGQCTRDHRRALRAMPNLVALELSEYFCLEADILDLEALNIIELPCLRKITWSGLCVQCHLILGSIHAPRLEEIDYRGDDTIWDSFLEQFLYNSKHTVTSLNLRVGNTELVHSFISSLPNIETLRLRGAIVTTELLQSLSFDESKPQNIGPRIKRIVFKLGSTNLVNILEEIVLMIESRLDVPNDANALQRLESVRVTDLCLDKVGEPHEPPSSYRDVFLPLKEKFLLEKGFSIVYEESYDF